MLKKSDPFRIVTIAQGINLIPGAQLGSYIGEKSTLVALLLGGGASTGVILTIVDGGPTLYQVRYAPEKSREKLIRMAGLPDSTVVLKEDTTNNPRTDCMIVVVKFPTGKKDGFLTGDWQNIYRIKSNFGVPDDQKIPSIIIHSFRRALPKGKDYMTYEQAADWYARLRAPTDEPIPVQLRRYLVSEHAPFPGLILGQGTALDGSHEYAIVVPTDTWFKVNYLAKPDIEPEVRYLQVNQEGLMNFSEEARFLIGNQPPLVPIIK